MNQLCIIGHVTKDLVRHGRHYRKLSGGVPIYAGITAASLGLTVSVLTKTSEADRANLCEPLLRHGISTTNISSNKTTEFENKYDADSWLTRKQVVRNIAEPFEIADLQGVDADLYYIGPLTSGDVPLTVVEELANSGQIVLDAQGFLREIRKRQVHLHDWKDKADYLPLITVLKVDHYEAQILTQENDLVSAARALEAFGPRQVIITAAERGSVVCENGMITEIPAYKPRRYVDPTGCGDTYLAAFIFMRLNGANTITSGDFASATSALKIEKFGPFAGNLNDVEDFKQESPQS